MIEEENYLTWELPKSISNKELEDRVCYAVKEEYKKIVERYRSNWYNDTTSWTEAIGKLYQSEKDIESLLCYIANLYNIFPPLK